MPEYLPIGAEYLVLVVALVLYFTDFGHLLYANEVVIAGSRHGTWTAIRPADGFGVTRRSAVFPRPYDPGSAELRMVLPGGGEPGDAADGLRAEIDRRLDALLVPRWLCRLLLVEIFLGIPLAWLQPSRAWPLFIMLVLVYGEALFLCAWLTVNRRRLEVPWKAALLLMFESVICIPYAINFHRKLARRMLTRQAAARPGVMRALLGDTAVPAAGDAGGSNEHE